MYWETHRDQTENYLKINPEKYGELVSACFLWGPVRFCWFYLQAKSMIFKHFRLWNPLQVCNISRNPTPVFDSGDNYLKINPEKYGGLVSAGFLWGPVRCCWFYLQDKSMIFKHFRPWNHLQVCNISRNPTPVFDSGSRGKWGEGERSNFFLPLNR
jgi:ABC-type histidine transport system ATPase subunit